MSDHLLTVSQLSCGYPQRPVLETISLPPCRAGTLTAVVGPNAAGKTTLLRAVAGLLPARGNVQFRGQNLLDLPVAELARIVTYMPQSLPRGVALTVIEAVMTALRVAPDKRGETESMIRQKAKAVLERLDIVHLEMRGLDELSGGQRQLVSLAQAIVRKPAILLLDEPTSALDPRHQIDVMSAVREAAANDNMVVMVVLHDLNLALDWADSVAILADGKLAAAGLPQEALTSQILESVYRIRARVEPCSQGRLHLIYDGKAS